MFKLDDNEHRFELDNEISKMLIRQGIAHVASSYKPFSKIQSLKPNETSVVVPLFRCNTYHPNMYNCMVCIKSDTSITFSGYTVTYELDESQIMESINTRHVINDMIAQNSLGSNAYKRNSNCKPFNHTELYDKSEIPKSVKITIVPNGKEPQFEQNVSWWKENFGNCGEVDSVTFSWKS
jgi:hypothetical protein